MSPIGEGFIIDIVHNQLAYTTVVSVVFRAVRYCLYTEHIMP